MIPFDAYIMFKAVKEHFRSDNYDYFRYHGKVRTKGAEAFDNSKMRWTYLRLVEKYSDEELLEFFVANVYKNPNLWEGELSDDVYLEYKAKKQSLSHSFENDLLLLKGTYTDFQSLFRIVNNEVPPIITMAYQGRISISTIVIMEILMNFLDTWKQNKLISDTIIWPDFAKMVAKMVPFMKLDKSHFFTILKKVYDK